jgi:arabinofuranosyltransferase
VLAIAAVPLAVTLWRIRLPVDDAFISLRYAENWARHAHHGWNPDDHVEGYSNLLWTALLALSWHDGSASLALRGLGSAALLVAIVGAHDAVRRMCGGRAAWLSTLILAGNWSLLTSAPLGLETPLVLAWLALVLRAAVRAHDGERGAWLEASIATGLGVLTRLDFVLLALPLLGAVWWTRRTLKALVLLAVPAGVLVGSGLAWNLARHGSILPATAAAKLSVPVALRLSSLLQGVSYVAAYLVLFGLGAFGLYGLRHARLPRPLRVGLLASAAAWSMYLVLIGGDWIGFRLATPLALLVVPIGSSSLALEDKAWAAGTVALLGALSAWLALEYGLGISVPFVQDRRAMVADTAEWSAIGKGLRRAFPIGMWEGSTVKIATTAAGAVPFFSKLWTFDLVGLNTPAVSREGVPHLALPGHFHHATVAQVRSAGVNLVLGRPEAMASGDWPRQSLERCRVAPNYFRNGGAGYEDTKIRVVAVPLEDGRICPMWYLTPSAEVEAALAQGRLVALPCP